MINAEFEQHCIELTDIEKRKKNAQNKVEELQLQANRLDDRKAAISNSEIGKKGRFGASKEKQITKLLAKQNDIENQLKHLGNQIENLEKQRTGIIENELPLMDGAVIQLVKGKTSGVTGGAVVKIKKDDVRRQYMLKNIFDTKKTYKNVFRQEKQHSGKHYYDPNCKSETRSFLTRHTLKEVNTSVIQEFIVLRLANVVSPGIAPGVILGEIEDTVNGEKVKRYCLLTEMAGQEKGETFCTLDATANIDTAKPYGVGKDVWKSFFAIGIGLLNDKDVAKKDNIGVVTKGSDQGANLSLFDLGHASPDEFKLDPETLLPKSKSRLADFVLWLINLFVPANSITGTFYFDKDIQGILTIDERKEAIQDLLSHKNDIMEGLERIKDDVPEGWEIVNDMNRRIEARFDQLNDVLEAHSKINATKTRKNENNVSHFSKQEERGQTVVLGQDFKQKLEERMESQTSHFRQRNGGRQTARLSQSSRKDGRDEAADASQPLAKNEKGKAGKDAGFIRSLFKKKKPKGDKVVDAARPFVRRNGGGQTADVSRSSSKRKVEGQMIGFNQAFVQELKERQKKRRGQSSEQNGGGEAADVDITIEEIPD